MAAKKKAVKKKPTKIAGAGANGKQRKKNKKPYA